MYTAITKPCQDEYLCYMPTPKPGKLRQLLRIEAIHQIVMGEDPSGTPEATDYPTPRGYRRAVPPPSPNAPRRLLRAPALVKFWPVRPLERRRSPCLQLLHRWPPQERCRASRRTNYALSPPHPLPPHPGPPIFPLVGRWTHQRPRELLPLRNVLPPGRFLSELELWVRFIDEFPVGFSTRPRNK